MQLHPDHFAIGSILRPREVTKGKRFLITGGRRILIALGFKIEIYSFSKILTPQNWGGVKISFGMDSP